MDFKECCPIGSNFVLAADMNGVGCCDATETDVNSDLYCCIDGYTFDDVTKTCIQKCPCEGCCGFNCCDQVDFFMHRAYEEIYHQKYATYAAFYLEWQSAFEEWWSTGKFTQ